MNGLNFFLRNYQETQPAESIVLATPKQFEWHLNEENIDDINSSSQNIDRFASFVRVLLNVNY